MLINVHVMGVKDLWRLLEPAGRPVNIESLDGKVLAVGKNKTIEGIHMRNVISLLELLIQFVCISKYVTTFTAKFRYRTCTN